MLAVDGRGSGSSTSLLDSCHYGSHLVEVTTMVPSRIIVSIAPKEILLPRNLYCVTVSTPTFLQDQNIYSGGDYSIISMVLKLQLGRDGADLLSTSGSCRISQDSLLLASSRDLVKT